MGYRGWVPVQKRVISIRDRDYLAGSDKRTNEIKCHSYKPRQSTST